MCTIRHGKVDRRGAPLPRLGLGTPRRCQRLDLREMGSGLQKPSTKAKEGASNQ